MLAPVLIAVGDLSLVTTIAAAFAAACLLGIVARRLKLSPIVGYLIAGIAIGPYTPGFKGNIVYAEQLAEIGVALLMFGVGLHFHLGDLLRVRGVAIPGAVGQSAVATLLGVGVAVAFGWPVKSGVVVGVAMAVASTVVLVRVLTDGRLLDTTHGHVAVGWLIVEDIFTVIVLVLIPAMGTPTGQAAPAGPLWLTLLIALAKLAVFVAIMLIVGRRVIPWLMVRVAKLRSRELFTLTVLVMGLAVATGSFFVFGASIALGAFLAGMVVGQSPVSHQAAADALPLRDAFAVLFFVSVGMLFRPMFVIEHPLLLLAGLGIVLLGKPLAAMVIVAVLGYPARTALVVALGLAQIGEFSFILSKVGQDAGLLDDLGHNLLVATAIVSLSINPMLFRQLPAIERRLQKFPRLWRFMNRKSLARERAMNAEAGETIERGLDPLAVVVGYGPVGRTVDGLLRGAGLQTVVVDLNLDTVQQIQRDGRLAIYGDAFNIEVIHQALARATHLIIALPHHADGRNPLIAAAKLINPQMKVMVRSRYIAEREDLEQVGADVMVYEEAEAAVALARVVLADRGALPDDIRRETLRIRQEFAATQAGM
jgi:CPA2 family monovalent cation:H+ antiporter-2